MGGGGREWKRDVEGVRTLHGRVRRVGRPASGWVGRRVSVSGGVS